MTVAGRLSTEKFRPLYSVNKVFRLFFVSGETGGRRALGFLMLFLNLRHSRGAFCSVHLNRSRLLLRDPPELGTRATVGFSAVAVECQRQGRDGNAGQRNG